MIIWVLSENNAENGFLCEHGLSYLIEIDSQKILFDTGSSDVFLKNARHLQLNIEKDVDTIVLSHGHWDHGNGLQFLSAKKLVTHPGSFVSRFRKKDKNPIGLKCSKQELSEAFTLETSVECIKLSLKLFFLGEIPRKTSFESQTTPFELANGKDDFVEDDSALVAIIEDSIVVLTGCSHAGICNICEKAKELSGISKIRAVVGGFHLKFDDHQTRKTIDYFKNHPGIQLFPSHCTAIPAIQAFQKEFDVKAVKTGMKIQFD